jgi:hypothetical protein
VTWGEVVVVVGASVVVVVGASVVVVVGVATELPPAAEEVVVGVVVVGVVVVVVGAVVVDDGVVSAGAVALLAPGCSLATTTPINAVAPVAASTADRVSRRRRTWARSRLSGVSLSV